MFSAQLQELLASPSVPLFAARLLKLKKRLARVPGMEAPELRRSLAFRDADWRCSLAALDDCSIRHCAPSGWHTIFGRLSISSVIIDTAIGLTLGGKRRAVYRSCLLNTEAV
eukprot:6172481-Pleurochrysis_carterae.AAC.1